MKRAFVGLLLLVVAGCGTSVERPKPLKIEQIAKTLAKQLDSADQAVREGKIKQGDLASINESLTLLRGHLKTKGLASQEQLDQIESICQRLRTMFRRGGADNAGAAAVLSDIRKTLSGIDAVKKYFG